MIGIYCFLNKGRQQEIGLLIDIFPVKWKKPLITMNSLFLPADDAQEEERKLPRTSSERVEDENENSGNRDESQRKKENEATERKNKPHPYLRRVVCVEEEEKTINRHLNVLQSSEFGLRGPLRKSPVKCPTCHSEKSLCCCFEHGESSRRSPEYPGFPTGEKPYEDSGSEKCLSLIHI